MKSSDRPQIFQLFTKTAFVALVTPGPWDSEKERVRARRGRDDGAPSLFLSLTRQPSWHKRKELPHSPNYTDWDWWWRCEVKRKKKEKWEEDGEQGLLLVFGESVASSLTMGKSKVS